MFGNSNSSFGNIFGGSSTIQQSHQRLFGGDRNLATKDIEGAQPRKFTKHVWGHFQSNEFNNGLSYNPQQSTLRSPILGDNVQPLNRAIPNSSGMVFRHQPSNTALGSTASSIQQGDHTKSTIALSTASGSLAKAAKSPMHSAITYPPNISLVERQSIRSNIPTSQLKEQNIFSPSAYFTIDPKLMTKPMVNVGSHLAYPNTDRPSITSQLANSSSQAALRNKRSPDSFTPSANQQKEYKREMISSYEFGRHSVKSDTPFLDDAMKAIGQNPIFSQNRNYGPDSVLHSEQNQGQPIRASGSNGFRDSLRQASRSGLQRELAPKQEDHQEHASQKVDLPIVANDPILQQKDNQYSFLRPASNRSVGAAAAAAAPGEVASSSAAPQEHQEYGEIKTKSAVRFHPTLRSSNIEQRIQSALSSRGKLVLGSPLVRRDITTNSEYGTYLNFQRPFIGTAQAGGNADKVLYQSKRDNFLRSHLTRSQSAEGTRLSQSVLSPTQQQMQLERKESAVRRGFNIIGNYPITYRNNPELFKSGYSAKQNNFIQEPTYPELKKSGSSFAPIAGMQNVYAEFNSENPLYNKSIKSPAEPHIKFFGAKALKNLSNVKLY